MADASELRQSLLARRKQLSLEEVQERSARIRENLTRFCLTRWTDDVWSSSCIGLYRVAEGNPLREVDPASLSGIPCFSLATFAYPRVRSLADGLLEFTVAPHSSDWKLGPFGLWEPRAELASIPPKEIGLMICPGVVFDEGGGRIGMGKGFYDRFLARAPGAYRIGLAYDFQVLKEPISLMPHDQQMDALITESRILTFDAGSPISE